MYVPDCIPGSGESGEAGLNLVIKEKDATVLRADRAGAGAGALESHSHGVLGQRRGQTLSPVMCIGAGYHRGVVHGGLGVWSMQLQDPRGEGTAGCVAGAWRSSCPFLVSSGQ